MSFYYTVRLVKPDYSLAEFPQLKAAADAVSARSSARCTSCVQAEGRLFFLQHPDHWKPATRTRLVGPTTDSVRRKGPKVTGKMGTVGSRRTYLQAAILAGYGVSARSMDSATSCRTRMTER